MLPIPGERTKEHENVSLYISLSTPRASGRNRRPIGARVVLRWVPPRQCAGHVQASRSGAQPVPGRAAQQPVRVCPNEVCARRGYRHRPELSSPLELLRRVSLRQLACLRAGGPKDRTVHGGSAQCSVWVCPPKGCSNGRSGCPPARPAGVYRSGLSHAWACADQLSLRSRACITRATGLSPPHAEGRASKLSHGASKPRHRTRSVHPSSFFAQLCHPGPCSGSEGASTRRGLLAAPRTSATPSQACIHNEATREGGQVISWHPCNHGIAIRVPGLPNQSAEDQADRGRTERRVGAVHERGRTKIRAGHRRSDLKG